MVFTCLIENSTKKRKFYIIIFSLKRSYEKKKYTFFFFILFLQGYLIRYLRMGVYFSCLREIMFNFVV